MDTKAHLSWSVVSHINDFREMQKDWEQFFEKNPLEIAELKGHSRIIFFTRNREIRIQMSMERLTDGFKKFMIVLDTLEDDAGKFHMIDLSFKDQVVVRDRISSHSKSMKTPTN